MANADAWVLFLAAFGFQLVASRAQIFDSNFATLWMATSILDGDASGVDFYDSGTPAQTALTTIFQAVLGYRVLSDFLLASAAIAIGTTLAYVLARSVTSSRRLGLWAASLAICAMPNFYSYPKVFLYPFTIWVCWRYLAHPSARGALLLGLTACLGFLFRHDHGIYVGAGVLATILIGALREGWRPLPVRLAWAAASLLALAPWVLGVQMTEGIPEYLRSRLDLAARLGLGGTIPTPTIAVDTAAPLVALTMPPPATINIRWTSEIDEAARRQLEQQYQLQPLRLQDPKGPKWEYAVLDTSRPNLTRLADDERVADTDRFDTGEARVIEPSVLTLQRQLGLPTGLEVAPGLFTRANAQTWLYYVFEALPFATLGVVAMGLLLRRRHRTSGASDYERPTAAAVLMAVAHYGLLRDPAYFADLAGPAGLLSAWLIWASPRLRVLTVAVAIVTAAFAVTYLDPAALAARLGFNDGPGNAWQQGASLIAQLRTRPPIDGQTISGSAAPIARYVYDCTRPSDRLLIVGSTPFDIPYFAERRIAGGQVYWSRGWRSSLPEQEATLAQLRSQSVPIAVSTKQQIPVLTYFEAYPLLHDYLVQNYYAPSASDGHILVDKRRAQTGVYRALDLPCFK